MSDPATSAGDDVVRSARRGLLLCRRGDWEEGLDLLGRAFDTPSEVVLPGTVYSYLGYGLAREHLKYRQGLSLCEHGLEVQPEEPENYLNLARTLSAMNRRGKALGILNRGLALEPGHEALVELRLSLGVRRAPVLGFLQRTNPLNRLLGRLRHRLRSSQ